MSETQWIRADSVIVGDGSAPLPDHAVRLSDGHIVEVVPGQKAPADADHCVGSTLAPGLIDAHAHLLFDFGIDHDVTRAKVVTSTRERLLSTALKHATDCLRAGVTTVRDLGDRDFIVAAARDAIAAGAVPGPTILTAGTPVTITAGHLGWLGGTADSPAQIVALTRSLVAQGVDVIKVMASGGNMTRESNTRLPQFTESELRLIVTEAHRGGKRVAAHAHNADSLRRSIAAGVDTLEHCGWRDQDGRPDLTQDDLDSMKASGSVGVATMAGIARQLLHDPEQKIPAGREVARAMSPSGGDLYADFEWARTMRGAGIDVVLASDAGVRFTPFSGFLDTLRAGVQALGVDAATAISLATGTAARALGIDHSVGTLAVGQRADIVTIGRTIHEGESQIGPVVQVRQSGTVVVQNGKVTW